MVAIFLTIMALVTLVLLTAPRWYRSETKLLVRLGRENVTIDPTATMGQGSAMAIPPSREDEINSVIDILGSRLLLEKLVDRFQPGSILDPSGTLAGRSQDSPSVGTTAEKSAAVAVIRDGNPAPSEAGLAFRFPTLPRFDPAAVIGGLLGASSPREQAVRHIKEHLSVGAVKKSNVITVRYEARSPDLAQAIVNALVELYLEQHGRQNRTPGSREFFARQTDELRDRLSAAEQALADAKSTTGVASVDDQRRILVELSGRLHDGLLAAKAELAIAQAEVRSLTARLAALPEMLLTERTTGFANEAADGMRQQLYTLQIEEQKLLSKYTEELPAVQEIRRQIAAAERILAREDANRTQERLARSAAHEELTLGLLRAQASEASLQAKASTLERQIADARTELSRLIDHATRITQLEREVELQEASYRKYSANLEQVRIDEALEAQRISNISVVQPPTFEPRPVRPRPALTLAFGLLFAAAASFGLGGLAERVEPSVS
jgi:uncharacterized protein involved in exopolysaccharide biosynthesis